MPLRPPSAAFRPVARSARGTVRRRDERPDTVALMTTPDVSTHGSSPPSFDLFWVSYLLHHKHPVTRLLHFVGTTIVLAAFVACVAQKSFAPALVGLVVGYAFAFAGHWYVEKNQPLTMKHPILAGLCNMRLFALEAVGAFRLGGGYEGAVKRALLVVPLAVVQGCADEAANNCGSC